MSPIEELYRLALAAELKTRSEDWRGSPDMEPFCLRIVELARAHPELRSGFILGFQRIVRERGLGDWEIIILCMHLLRWPEIKAWAEEQHRTCIAEQDWRGDSVYRCILEAFEDDWDERQIFAYFRRANP